MPGRILLTEPVSSNRIALKALLSEGHFDTICIDSAENFHNSIAKERPDVILLSPKIGDVDGYQLCKMLKADPAYSHIPIVIVSHSFDELNWAKAITNLVDDVFLMPADTWRLSMRLRRLYRSKTELDTLKIHADITPRYGFAENQNATAFNHSRPMLIAHVLDENASPVFNLEADFGKVTRFKGIDQSKQIREITELIILENAVEQLNLLEQLLSNPITQNIPILAILSEADREKSHLLIELGCSDIVYCAASNKQLLARAHSLITRTRQKNTLQKLVQQRLREANFDSLTGLHNRRHADNFLRNSFQNARSRKKDLVALLLDIDNFKNINDTFGHAAGDKVLNQLAERLQSNVRGMDMIARVGGEEFMVVVSDLSMKRAKEVGERLRHIISDTEFDLPNGNTTTITASIGIATLNSRHSSPEDLVSCADKALYKAKSSGRNCISVYKAA